MFTAGAETVTFIRLPFPLDEAPQHLAQLQHWGLTFGELSILLPVLFSADICLLSSVKSISLSPGRLSSMMAHMFSIILSSGWLTDCATCIYRGIYDASYLSYLCVVLSLLPQFGLTVFVALHQDIWLHYTSGSDAPV